MAEDVEELQRLQKQVRATIKERSSLEQGLANPDAHYGRLQRGPIGIAMR